MPLRVYAAVPQRNCRREVIMMVLTPSHADAANVLMSISRPSATAPRLLLSSANRVIADVSPFAPQMDVLSRSERRLWETARTWNYCHSAFGADLKAFANSASCSADKVLTSIWPFHQCTEERVGR